jgi:hypothetical protein
MSLTIGGLNARRLFKHFTFLPLDGRGVASTAMRDVLPVSVLCEVLTVLMPAVRSVSNIVICFLVLLSCVRVFPKITMRGECEQLLCMKVQWLLNLTHKAVAKSVTSQVVWFSVDEVSLRLRVRYLSVSSSINIVFVFRSLQNYNYRLNYCNWLRFQFEPGTSIMSYWNLQYRFEWNNCVSTYSTRLVGVCNDANFVTIKNSWTVNEKCIQNISWCATVDKKAYVGGWYQKLLEK